MSVHSRIAELEGRHERERDHHQEKQRNKENELRRRLDKENADESKDRAARGIATRSREEHARHVAGEVQKLRAQGDQQYREIRSRQQTERDAVEAGKTPPQRAGVEPTLRTGTRTPRHHALHSRHAREAAEIAGRHQEQIQKLDSDHARTALATARYDHPRTTSVHDERRARQYREQSKRHDNDWEILHASQAREVEKHDRDAASRRREIDEVQSRHKRAQS
jgi:hypothetical protein